MVEGIFTAARSFTLDDIQYHVMVYRVGVDYRAFWQCDQCGFNDNQDPSISLDCNKATDAARQLAEQHHGQIHGRYAATLAAADEIRETRSCDGR